MASSEIGSLFVSLGLDSAVFTAGVKKVQGATAKLQKGLESFGNRANAVGQKLSVVSAGMAALGAAGFAMVKGAADAGVMIERQAQAANAGAREFQLMAAGARSVGIENDKLADILKDVNDRVGEFVQTGGGPMKDFFENVAPKVGVTADQFARLSGPQALQLYVDTLQKAGLSQQEMTFYLEAMASDATALIPLLANGGAEMARLGAAADAAGGIMSDKAIAASKGFNEQLRLLMEGAGGLRNIMAEALLPVMTSLLQTVNTQVIPAIAALVEKIGGAVEWFAQLPGPVQEAAGVIAAALGLGGPVLLAVGALSTALAGLVAATGPIGLFIAAAALLTSAWMAWGDDIKAIFNSAIDTITQKYASLNQGWVQLQTDMRNAVAAAVEAVKAKFDELLAWFQALPAKMLEIGGQIVQGLIDGIMAKWEALKAQVYALAESMPQWMRDLLGVKSPSRVFREIGQFVTQGLGLGLQDGVPQVQGAMQSVTDAVTESGGLIAGMESFRDVAMNVFSAVAIEGRKLGDVLRDLASSWLGNAANNLMGSAFDTLFGIGANANGTRDWRGGLTRVNERGGEIMNLPSGTQIIPHDVSKRMAGQSGGAVDVRVSVDNDGNLQAYVNRTAGAVSARIVGQYDKQAMPQRLQQAGADPRRRG